MIDIPLILITALCPVALLLWYIYKSDPIKEPKEQLAKAFLYGVLIVPPVVIVELLLQYILFRGNESQPTLLTTFSDAFLVAALTEEAFKLLALWFLLKKNPYFDEHIDGIVYAVFISLGFAALENVTYLFSNYEMWITVGITRALLAVPGHYAFGILMGFFYSLYYFGKRSARNKRLIFLAPFLAHGLYDLFAMSSVLSPMMAIVCFICLIGFCIWMHRFCRKRISSHLHRDRKVFGNQA
ncbi:MAG: PrsW family intramembrane metalloprotease [Prevotella sp.]|nr:PrsW family intramembrane metalloprotease [Prevotella sp.]